MKIKTGKTSIIAVVLALVIAALTVFTGCEGETEPVVIDIDAVAKSIYEGVKFDDELAKLDSEAVKYLYGIEDGISAVVYIGSGATAEEIAVFDAGDDAGGEMLQKTVEKHITDQIESYRNYVPAEVARLEKAVIVREGRYVLLCVTDDTAAAKGIMETAVGK